MKTLDEIRDYFVRNYGFEDERTIRAFQLIDVYARFPEITCKDIFYNVITEIAES